VAAGALLPQDGLDGSPVQASALTLTGVIAATAKSVTVEMQAKPPNKFEDFIDLFLVLVLMIMIAIVIIIMAAFVSPLTVLVDDVAAVVVAAKDDDVRRGWSDHDHAAAGTLRVARAAG
jgi:hypothetical protein